MAAKTKIKWLNFRHPRTGCEVRVHPLDVGRGMLYVRWGWGLLLPTDA